MIPPALASFRLTTCEFMADIEATPGTPHYSLSRASLGTEIAKRYRQIPTPMFTPRSARER